jgi:hypothetical protein
LVYLTAFCHVITNGRITGNNELVGIWKDAVIEENKTKLFHNPLTSGNAVAHILKLKIWKLYTCP